uniref:Uncharacterized protein n=1 Tax=Arundo donax TaxID=35708 RepID=A0A0A9E7H4_ARUDO
MAMAQLYKGSFYHHRLEAALLSMIPCAASPTLPSQNGSHYVM